MSSIEMVPFFVRPVGYMRCVACSDYKRIPGRMWLGYTKGGEDLLINCPVCKGTGLVTQVKYFDARTGLEIDYERPGQKFVHVTETMQGGIVLTDQELTTHGGTADVA